MKTGISSKDLMSHLNISEERLKHAIEVGQIKESYGYTFSTFTFQMKEVQELAKIIQSERLEKLASIEAPETPEKFIPLKDFLKITKMTESAPYKWINKDKIKSKEVTTKDGTQKALHLEGTIKRMRGLLDRHRNETLTLFDKYYDKYHYYENYIKSLEALENHARLVYNLEVEHEIEIPPTPPKKLLDENGEIIDIEKAFKGLYKCSRAHRTERLKDVNTETAEN